MDFPTIVSLSLFSIFIGIVLIGKLLDYLGNRLLKSHSTNSKKSKDQDLYKEANPIWQDI